MLNLYESLNKTNNELGSLFNLYSSNVLLYCTTSNHKPFEIAVALHKRDMIFSLRWILKYERIKRPNMLKRLFIFKILTELS